MSRPSRLWATLESNWTIALFFIFGLAFLINLALFYPGYMSPDSLDQLGQALGVIPVNDWHPPIMVFIWSTLIAITGHTSSMLLFQLMIFWLSLGLLAVFIFKSTESIKRSLLPLVVGIIPPVIAISGVIWKDVQMAYVLALATVLLLFVSKFKTKKASKIIIYTLIFGLIIYGALLRYNAIFSVLPIVYVALSNILAKKKAWVRYAVSLIVVAVIPLTGFIFNHFIVHAKSENPLSSVMLDDVININSYESLTQTAPVKIQGMLTMVKRDCEEKQGRMNSYWLCLNDDQRKTVKTSGYEDLKSYWILTLLNHPLGYMEYRIETFALFIFVPDRYVYIWQKGIEANTLDQNVKSPSLGFALEAYIKGFGYRHLSFLFEPWFWLIVNIAVLYLARKAVLYKKYIMMLSVSSLFYILTYIPVVVAADYRYIYWSVIASLFAILLLIIESGTLRIRTKNFHIKIKRSKVRN